MARITIRRQPLILPVLMAEDAGSRRMRSRQREDRRIMIERRRQPCRHRMTRCTIVRELTGDMIRRRRFRKVCAMARIAICGQSLVLPVFMTCSTCRGLM